MTDLTLDEQKSMWKSGSFDEYWNMVNDQPLSPTISEEIHLAEYAPDPVMNHHPLSTVQHGISFDDHLKRCYEP